jgi:hypothetical protein
MFCATVNQRHLSASNNIHVRLETCAISRLHLRICDGFQDRLTMGFMRTTMSLQLNHAWHSLPGHHYEDPHAWRLFS